MLLDKIRKVVTTCQGEAKSRKRKSLRNVVFEIYGRTPKPKVSRQDIGGLDWAWRPIGSPTLDAIERECVRSQDNKRLATSATGAIEESQILLQAPKSATSTRSSLIIMCPRCQRGSHLHISPVWFRGIDFKNTKSTIWMENSANLSLSWRQGMKRTWVPQRQG
jgi:hypothetical protein